MQYICLAQNRHECQIIVNAGMELFYSSDRDKGLVVSCYELKNETSCCIKCREFVVSNYQLLKKGSAACS
jgi:hypothetical protein